MAELGSYQIPKEFKDEDKWFRYFTKKQLIFVGGAIFLSVVITSFFSGLGLIKVGISISEVILLLTIAVAFIRIPTDRYLIGGGYHIMQILMRLVIKRLKQNRILYVKNYSEEKF
jgi:hypothetical protein